MQTLPNTYQHSADKARSGCSVHIAYGIRIEQAHAGIANRSDSIKYFDFGSADKQLPQQNRLPLEQ